MPRRGNTFTRRDMLKLGILSGGYALLSPKRGMPVSLPSSPRTPPFLEELPIASIAREVAPFPTRPDPADCINVDGSRAFHVAGPRSVPPGTKYFLMHERAANHSFHPNLPPNSIWGYDGQAPGPTFLAQSGTPFLVRFVNDLPENDPVGIGEPITAVHRHGGFQAPEDDGYPLDTFSKAQSRDYFYPNRPDDNEPQNEHSTQWYHDHAIDVTAQNVYRGLAGFYLNFDAVDSMLGEQDPSPTGLRLPGRMTTRSGGVPFREFDIPLVIQDRLFDRQGLLVYDSFDHNGFLGDRFLVNGKIQPFFRVQRRKYRFRILNGSSARFYELSLSNGQPFVAIGTDSILLERPVPVRSFRIGPAERVEVVVDFRGVAGDEVFLVNRLEQDDGRKPGDLVSPGTPLLKFLVNRQSVSDPSRVPATLRPITENLQELLARVKVQRRFKFERSDGAWTINGEFFDENRIQARPKLGEPEIWILAASGGWAHPVHIHLSDMFILSRNGRTPPPLERGRKDTVVIGADAGDVKILIEFDEFVGRYVFHCHNIEHEDMRMMAQFEIEP